MDRIFLPVAALLAACAPEAPTLESLPVEEQVAVSAAIEGLDPVRADLPVEDDELEAMAVEFVELTRPDVGCDVRGVLSGVWYEADVEPVIEGSWFELGTGDLGGTLQGTYGEGAFAGTFDSDDPSGTIEGRYGDDYFLGTWVVVGDDGAAGPEGDFGGYYERRNELGGYFFGLWGDCG